MISRLLTNTDLTCLPLIGGTNIKRQLERLKKIKPFVVVGTPGRLLDLVQNRNKLNIKNVIACVMDEADEMLKAPHRDDLEGLIRSMPRSHCQLIAASATSSSNDDVIYKLKNVFKHRQNTIKEPFILNKFGNDDLISPMPASVEHVVILRPQQKYIETLKSILLSDPEPGAVLVFVNDVVEAKRVCDKLGNMNIVVASLLGETSKEDRALVNATPLLPDKI